jgi:hypothetical protein
VLFSSTSFVCLSPRGLQEGQRQLVFFARRGRYAAWPYLSALLAGSIMLAASAECDAFFPLMGCAVLIMMGQGWFLPGSTWRLKNVVRYSSMYAAVSHASLQSVEAGGLNRRITCDRGVKS